jgi:hypothetical protein
LNHRGDIPQVKKEEEEEEGVFCFESPRRYSSDEKKTEKESIRR